MSRPGAGPAGLRGAGPCRLGVVALEAARVTTQARPRGAEGNGLPRSSGGCSGPAPPAPVVSCVCPPWSPDSCLLQAGSADRFLPWRACARVHLSGSGPAVGTHCAGHERLRARPLLTALETPGNARMDWSTAHSGTLPGFSLGSVPARWALGTSSPSVPPSPSRPPSRLVPAHALTHRSSTASSPWSCGGWFPAISQEARSPEGWQRPHPPGGPAGGPPIWDPRAAEPGARCRTVVLLFAAAAAAGTHLWQEHQPCDRWGWVMTTRALSVSSSRACLQRPRGWVAMLWPRGPGELCSWLQQGGRGGHVSAVGRPPHLWHGS